MTIFASPYQCSSGNEGISGQSMWEPIVVRHPIISWKMVNDDWAKEIMQLIG